MSTSLPKNLLIRLLLGGEGACIFLSALTKTKDYSIETKEQKGKKSSYSYFTENWCLKFLAVFPCWKLSCALVMSRLGWGDGKEESKMKVYLFGFLKSFQKWLPNKLFLKAGGMTRKLAFEILQKNDLCLPFGLFANISRRIFVRWPGPWALFMRSFWTLWSLRFWWWGFHSSTTATARWARGRTVSPFPMEQSPQNIP